MTRHSTIWSLIFATGMVIAYPATGIPQTTRENAEAKRLFTEGEALQRDGKFVEAEKKFREALNRYPKADQSDKTAYYLIDTLIKLRRVQDARVEIDKFRRNYPQSKWQGDVTERMLTLGGLPNPPTEAPIWNSPEERREAQYLADLLRGAFTPVGPRNKIYADGFPMNASTQAVLLRQIIQMDRDKGIDNANELLKANPSDPAVGANLGTIANSESPKAVPFLLGVWVNAAATPNMRNLAFFWFSRMNPNKEEVAKAIMDLLARRETEAVASEALHGMTVDDHRAVLEKIAMSSNPDKFTLMERIYRNGSSLLKRDLLMFISKLNDPKATPFIMDAAQNDADPAVRRTAVQALGNRKDVDVTALEKLMKALPPAPPQLVVPSRLVQPTAPPSGSSIPSLPSPSPRRYFPGSN